MRKLFFISIFMISILPILCSAQVVQNPINLTGTVWKYIFQPGSSMSRIYINKELKFISATEGEVWMQPVTGLNQKMVTLTYLVNGTTITITPNNDVPKTAKIDFEKNTITPTDPTTTYVFTKE